MKFLLFLLLIPATATAQYLRQTKGYAYSLDKSGIHSDTILYKILWHDTAGRIVKEEMRTSDSHGAHRVIKYYDSSGKVMRKEGIYSDSTFFSNTDFIRDEHGEILQQIFSGTDDTVVLQSQNSYGPNGKLLQTVLHPRAQAEPGVVQRVVTITYEYDSSNRLLRMRQSMGETLVSDFVVTYDEVGNRHSEVTTTSAGTDRFVFEYDPQHRKRVQAYYKDDVLQSTTTYSYMENDLTGERTQHPDGSADVIFYKKS